MRRILIFDLDGTLVNSLPDIAAAMNHVLMAHGLEPHPTEAYALMVGNGALNIARRALGGREDLLAEVYACYRRQYSAHLDERTFCYPGMPGVLGRLRGKGYTVGVVSNKDQGDVERVLRHCFPDFAFDAAVGLAEGAPLKPDPAPANRLLACLGAEKAELYAVIGDSAVDARFAQALGVPCVGCGWGFRGRAELEGAGADRIAEEPGELPDLIDGLRN